MSSSRTIRRTLATLTLVLCFAAFAACSKSDANSAGGRPPVGEPSAAPSPSIAPWDPKIDPANFTHKITNPYFPLEPGTTRISAGRKDGVPQVHELSVLRQTRVIMGVRCAFVKDVVTSNGEMVEKTSDWYAQDADGNVWYFGEATADFAKGVVTSTAGSWEAGVDNAKPGIIMQANPKPGPKYYSEYRPGIAEDQGQVLKTGTTLRIPAGNFDHVIIIKDTNPLDPTLVQHKWYAKGVGIIQTVRTGSSHRERYRLVEIRKG
jgi:hypothetical protein